jgi:hypothetical protein
MGLHMVVGATASGATIMVEQMRRTRRNTQAQSMARALGWFSIALGVAELMAPGSIKRNVGTPGPKGVVQGYGLREIVTGIGILASPKPVGMVWGRVAGDMLDIATLLPALNNRNRAPAAAEGALAFVIAATAMDIYVAMQGDRMAEKPNYAKGLRLERRPPNLAEGVAPANRLPSPGAASIGRTGGASI